MTGNTIISALLLTLVAGSATGVGGALVLFKKKLSSGFLAGALGLSAGVMIFISMAEMLPESQDMVRVIANKSKKEITWNNKKGLNPKQGQKSKTKKKQKG